MGCHGEELPSELIAITTVRQIEVSKLLPLAEDKTPSNHGRTRSERVSNQAIQNPSLRVLSLEPVGIAGGCNGEEGVADCCGGWMRLR
jgi:hypothetical protein